MVYDDGIDTLQLDEFIKTDLLLSKKRHVEPGDLEGDLLALLPRRMPAYALWERKFVQLDVRDINLPDFKDRDDTAFENLQIPGEHKTLIQSLVYSHFRKRLNETTTAIGTQDLIRGKGKGIVILLFGVPGVGKTATAEAVAQKFKKPLFSITCGELSFTAKSVEASLTEVFRLAHLWDCVLLLDEADVFITQRERKDLERNALVSVFLRMLEYYNGILFLTTNRPGILDEAIKSRVHLNLRYNFLDQDQVVAIFKLNIWRLKEIEEEAASTPGYSKLYVHENDFIEFAEAHWKNHTNGIGRWNGRQISNAFLIAASLAHYESDVGERRHELQKQLTSKHFKKVEETTRKYDEYRASCLGDTDSEFAFDRLERDDGWNSYARAASGPYGPVPAYSVPQGHESHARRGSMPLQAMQGLMGNHMNTSRNGGWGNNMGGRHSSPIHQPTMQQPPTQQPPMQQPPMQQSPMQQPPMQQQQQQQYPLNKALGNSGNQCYLTPESPYSPPYSGTANTYVGYDPAMGAGGPNQQEQQQPPWASG